jgi:hypothetical protein
MSKQKVNAWLKMASREVRSRFPSATLTETRFEGENRRTLEWRTGDAVVSVDDETFGGSHFVHVRFLHEPYPDLLHINRHSGKWNHYIPVSWSLEEKTAFIARVLDTVVTLSAGHTQPVPQAG